MQKSGKYTIIRSAAFIFFFAEYIPLAFLPLFIKDIYELNPVSYLGISKQMMLGLPISSYMLGVTIFVLVAGSLLESISLLRSFVMFGVLLVIGSALSAFSQNVLQFIIFRFISGMGYGGVLVSGITLIIQNTDLTDRTTGFGHWLAGSSSATVCAVPVGSVIASYLGFRTAMLFSALFSVVLILFVIYVAYRLQLKWLFSKHKEDISGWSDGVEIGSRAKFKLGHLFGVFKDINVFSTLIFASIPVQIAFIGFLHYAFPLYLDSIGISQSNIGRFITLYGLACIIFNPLVSKWSDRLENERIFMIIGNFIIGLVLISFSFAKNIYMILVVISIVGMGNAFVTSTTGTYITLSREARRIGASRLSSIFKSFQKLGTIAGPMLIGILISIYGYIEAMIAIGVMILFGLIFFIMFSRRLRRQKEAD